MSACCGQRYLLNCGKEAIGTHTNPNWTLLSRTRSSLNVAKSFFSVSVVQRRDIVNNVFEVSNDSRPPALQNILEKGVRELGANRLIDSRIGVPGQLACNPRVILGRFRTTIRFASLQLRVLLVNLRLYSIHSDIHRTSGSLGRHFCWTNDTDADVLTCVASDRQHRWLGILDFASRTGHRAVVL